MFSSPLSPIHPYLYLGMQSIIVYGMTRLQKLPSIHNRSYVKLVRTVLELVQH